MPVPRLERTRPHPDRPSRGSILGRTLAALSLMLGVLVGIAAQPAAAVVAFDIQVSLVNDDTVRVEWTTDVPATTQVNWGETSAYGSEYLDQELTIFHSAELQGLECDTEYHYAVTSDDGVGPAATSEDNIVVTGPCAAAPLRPLSIIADQFAATITWETALPATGIVTYGLDNSYGSAAVEGQPVTFHEVMLTDLECGTTYQFSAISEYEDGTTTSSGNQSFQTYECSPFIDEISVSVGQTSASILWLTEAPAESQVIFGPTIDYGSAAGSSDLVTAHRVDLSDLDCSTEYHFRILSVAGDGTANWSPARSFSTEACDDPTTEPDPEGPVLSDVDVSAGPTTARLAWTTDVIASAGVVYGTTSAYGGEAQSATPGTEHVIDLVDLQCGTLYNYRAFSTGGDGLSTWTGNLNFVTGPCGEPSDPADPADPPADDEPDADPIDQSPSFGSIEVEQIDPNTVAIVFSTGIESDASVLYGPTNVYGTEVRSAHVGVDHRVELLGLDCDAVYQYRVLATGPTGLVAGSPNQAFQTAPCSAEPAPFEPPNPTAPVPPLLFNVTVVDVTTSSATVMWQTTDVTDATVTFGLTNSYGSAASATVNGRTHRVVLSDLDCGEIYNFSAVSVNENGLSAGSGNHAFATQACDAAAIRSVDVTTTDSTATITWITDVLADASVIFGPTEAYGAAEHDPTAATDHSITLGGLACDAVYHYRIISRVGSALPSYTQDLTFATAGCEVTTPPEPTEPEPEPTEPEPEPTEPEPEPEPEAAPVIFDIVMTASADTVEVSWATDVHASGSVVYGMTTDYGNEAISTAFSTAQSVLVDGLTCGTTYNMRIVATGGTGELTASDNLEVATQDCVEPELGIHDLTVEPSVDSAMVRWNSGVAATAGAIFGPTTSYGRNAIVNDLTIDHELLLDELDCDTEYHFRVYSTTSDGSLVSSVDQVFTTAPCTAGAAATDDSFGN